MIKVKVTGPGLYTNFEGYGSVVRRNRKPVAANNLLEPVQLNKLNNGSKALKIGINLTTYNDEV